jgi:hypothetical protein
MLAMGVRNLSKALKECGGQHETRFKDPGMTTHVDLLSRFFRLIQVRVFDIVKRHIKNAQTESQTPHFLETYNIDDTKKRRILNEHQPSTTTPSRRAHLPYDPTLTLDQLIELSVQELDPKNLFTHPEGLSTVAKEQDKVNNFSLFIFASDKRHILIYQLRS